MAKTKQNEKKQEQELEATASEVTEAEITEAEATVTEITEAEVTVPENTEPKTTEPEVESEADDGGSSVMNIVGDDARNAIRDSIINGTILKGEISGTVFFAGQLCVQVTYPIDFPNPVTVNIGIERFGVFDLKSIRNNIAHQFQEDGAEVTDEAVDKEYNKRLMNAIVRMYGAKIFFVPIEYIEETDTIFGDRTIAERRIRKANWMATEHRVPKQHKGTSGAADILRVDSTSMLVNYYGYICRLNPEQISPLAVDFSTYYAGGKIRCIVTDVAEDYKSIKLVASKYDSDLAVLPKKLHEYKYGDRVLAKIIRYIPYNGMYVLRLPNGSAGYTHISGNLVYSRPHQGDSVQALIVGLTKDQKGYNCSIKTVIKQQ